MHFYKVFLGKHSQSTGHLMFDGFGTGLRHAHPAKYGCELVAPYKVQGSVCCQNKNYFGAQNCRAHTALGKLVDIPLDRRSFNKTCSLVTSNATLLHCANHIFQPAVTPRMPIVIKRGHK